MFSFLRRTSAVRASQRKHNFRPCLEALETRALPAPLFGAATILPPAPSLQPSVGQTFLQSKFETVFTTKIDLSGPGAEGPEESISFVYGQLEVKYSNQEATGPVNKPPAMTPPEQALPTPTAKPFAAVQPAPATVGSFALSGATLTTSTH
jgi:hypothetical protein